MGQGALNIRPGIAEPLGGECHLPFVGPHGKGRHEVEVEAARLHGIYGSHSPNLMAPERWDL